MKPYGYVRADGQGIFIYGEHQFQNVDNADLVPVYLHPKEWVGLTDEEKTMRASAYDEVLQIVRELRPAAVAMKTIKDRPAEWWLDKVAEEVKALKEKNT